MRKTRNTQKTAIERFNEKVQISESGCHEWTGSVNDKGYGGFRVRSYKTVLAHRFIWEYNYGPLPAKTCILHKCDNRGCVNPDHLFMGSQADNIRDMHKKGRARKAVGEKAAGAKLTETQVLAIKALFADGVMPAQVKRHLNLNVSLKTVQAIRQRKYWTHIP